MDLDISLAVSTRMPYCPILTFEDDSTYKHAKDKLYCNSFLLAPAPEAPLQLIKCVCSMSVCETSRCKYKVNHSYCTDFRRGLM